MLEGKSDKDTLTILLGAAVFIFGRNTTTITSGDLSKTDTVCKTPEQAMDAAAAFVAEVEKRHGPINSPE